MLIGFVDNLDILEAERDRFREIVSQVEQFGTGDAQTLARVGGEVFDLIHPQIPIDTSTSEKAQRVESDEESLVVYTDPFAVNPESNTRPEQYLVYAFEHHDIDPYGDAAKKVPSLFGAEFDKQLEVIF